MSDICFTVDCRTSAEEMYSLLKGTLDDEKWKRQEALQKFDPKLGVECKDEQQEIRILSSKFKAQLNFEPTEEGQSRLCVRVKLPLLLVPFKGVVKKVIQNALMELKKKPILAENLTI